MKWKRYGSTEKRSNIIKKKELSTPQILSGGTVTFFSTLTVILTLVLSPAFADFSGRIVGVWDGDTIKVTHNGKVEKIRLYGIDCPEKAQPFGTKAKQSTSAIVFGKDVTIMEHGHDKYTRTLAEVLLPDGMNLNQELVKQGWCWWYRQYAPGDTVLEGLERDAREGRTGLWVDPQPVPPWEWRKRRR